MVEVKRKKGESFESFLRRFNQRVIKSGTILQVRKIRYHKGTLNLTKKKAAALRRMEIANKIDYLRKTGQLKEDTLKRRKF